MKKILGTMLVASMLCMLVATGCADDNTTKENTATEGVTEATTEAVTETATEAEPKETVIVKAYYDPKLEEQGITVYGITDLGITVEGTNSNYDYLRTTSITTSEDGGTITDERIKDVINIEMEYNDYELAHKDEEFPEIYLKEKVKVSIPYEEGMYILESRANGVVYDINAEYIDGNYVFETDELGEFFISTESTGRTEPTKTENVELAQQTITDERTGVQVSGMLPVDAKMMVTLQCIDETIESDRYDFPYLFENDYSNVKDVLDFYVTYNDEVEDIPIAELIDHEGWAEHEVTAGGKIWCKVEFEKDFEVLDFESDLTVTLPFDYHNALAISEVFGNPGKATAVAYDYDKQEFITLDVVPLEDTPEGKFQVKTKTPGRFFIGGEVRIDQFIDYYKTQANYKIEE